MDNSLFRSVLQTVQKHVTLTPNHFTSTPNDRLLFDHRLAHGPLLAPLPELSSQLSSFGFPAPLNSELQALLSKDLSEDKIFIEQTQQRLLQQLSTLSTSPDPSTVPSLVRAAFNAFHHRSVNARVEALHRELSEYEPQEGSASESEGASDSEQDSDEGDDHKEDEEAEGLGDEDDNAPIRPGEDIPPLETKYLPIFEALHERGKVLTKPEKTYLVNMTGMTYRQITIWFQNRRRGELKEHAQRIPISHVGSADSYASSEASGDEGDLEQKLAVPRSDATFDIRSWRLTSALPIKAGAHGSFPTSPTKVNFGDSAIDSDSDSGDTDLSDDSSDGHNVPPGLQAPSLSTSITTIDSTATASTSSNGVSGMAIPPVVPNGDEYSGAKSTSRITKPLPARRSNPTPVQGTPAQPQFTFDFGHANLGPAQPQPQPTPTSVSPHLVTSNVRGLTVEMNTTPPLSTTTLQLPSSSHSAPTIDIHAPTSASSNGSSPRHSALVASPPRNISPTPSGHSASSPRPPVKPLPRRTGCAPRPRPPPRVSPPAASATPLSSARPSVVLPPSSNPSLGNATLGSLLRPNQPAPRIPPEMEERLAAMAGRMGVGKDVNPNPAARQFPGIAPIAPRPGFVMSSFGPTSLPRSHMPLISTTASTSGQSSQSLSKPPQPR